MGRDGSAVRSRSRRPVGAASALAISSAAGRHGHSARSTRRDRVAIWTDPRPAALTPPSLASTRPDPLPAAPTPPSPASTWPDPSPGERKPAGRDGEPGYRSPDEDLSPPMVGARPRTGWPRSGLLPATQPRRAVPVRCPGPLSPSADLARSPRQAAPRARAARVPSAHRQERSTAPTGRDARLGPPPSQSPRPRPGSLARPDRIAQEAHPVPWTTPSESHPPTRARPPRTPRTLHPLSQRHPPTHARGRRPQDPRPNRRPTTPAPGMHAPPSWTSTERGIGHWSSRRWAATSTPSTAWSSCTRTTCSG